MDFMKVLDQTVREIKREVNLKVLKVPETEQKVLDATSDEPWGPHGSALSEIAQATKKFTECQMIMNVLWTRLSDTGSKWRHVYKALAVIEYLIANGSERAVDDILEHTFQISALSGFEYVEPNGKDVGINVRKKAETILALLNDKEKIQAVREKAAATRDKYFGLSSTGITYKSSGASYSSGGFSDRYGSLSGSRDDDTFRDNYRDSELHKSAANKNEVSKSKKPVAHQTRDQDSSQSNSRSSTKPGLTPPPKSASVQASSSEDDFDDFDPRGSSKTGSTNTSPSQVDLFGQSLAGNFMDEPVSLPTETTTHGNPATTEVDLFADATFQSASPQAGATATCHTQGSTDLFASQPAIPAAFPSNNVDFFAAPDPGLPTETKSPISEPASNKIFDPFAAIPLNNFESSDPFGAFTSHSEPAATKPSQQSTTSSLNKLDETFGAFTSYTEVATTEPSQHSTNNSLNNLDQTSLTASKPAAKKDTFQVKSGIWADSLSRGLIDLNITAPKKVNLADIGIVGGLSDGSDEKEKGLPTSAYMGRAMGTGTGLGRSGFPSSTAMGGSGNF
ncbi:clathrin interactor EPSIN 1 [Elaeis guineensis]|uniref:Clathrin interactor EPSIN 1 n=1 Tax=Elaeis guineensis var. tenera TaxID=51953 RepID=A0A6I9QXC7_ELAGV|nr:clathrin interactor EPSIN 1 [Elaeis guineensis]